jgi:exodeoxyribonuclease V gamma subunit
MPYCRTSAGSPHCGVRLQAALTPAERDLTRAGTHRRFLDALQRAPVSGARAFRGHAAPHRAVRHHPHSPPEFADAIAALAAHCQVLLAMPNPCRFHWADIIDGRELLRIERRRQPLRRRARPGCRAAGGRCTPTPTRCWPPGAARRATSCASSTPSTTHRQARQRFGLPRVDLFDEESAGAPLLQQVQAASATWCRWPSTPAKRALAADRSIVFHVAHSALREVEVLHDQLLQLLANPPGGAPLQPRDIVVMVPDIDTFAPAIRSVFGQYPRWDARTSRGALPTRSDRGQQPAAGGARMAAAPAAGAPAP